MAIEQWLVDGQKTIDIERIRRVKANLIGGSIAVLAHNEPQARVEVASTTVRNLKVAIDGDTLVIDHPQLSLGEVQTSARTLWNRPAADISILVPANIDVDIKAASAEVLVVGITGDVAVATAAGEQFVDGTTGALSLSTVDAEISVRDHAGRVATKTVAGDVTVSGDVLDFSGATVSGTTVLDITGGQPDRITNRTVTGATTIRIPADVTPSYRVSTVTATASLEGEPQQPSRGQTFVSPVSEHERHLTEVVLQTVAGRITVVRAGQGEADGDGAADAAGAASAAGATGAAGVVEKAAPGRKVFRRIVKPDFDERIDARVASASEQLGVEPDVGTDAGAAGEQPGAGTDAAAEASSDDTQRVRHEGGVGGHFEPLPDPARAEAEGDASTDEQHRDGATS